ncbi:MAG: hypothetical protein K6G31_00295 [Paludibacteraceae bacterium]|nr:hypothetical protein [Paludibacteraceae bacterium]
MTLWKGLFKTVELQSKVGEIKEVAARFKYQPNKGSIVIDEPEEDDYNFHILQPAKQ